MQEPRNAQRDGVSPTILVVDDEVPITGLCKALLEAEGFTVLEANGSAEALKICTHHQGSIDLLLADLILPPPGFQFASSDNPFPHLNGHDLALRASTIRSELRIILMSGNPDKELASHGVKRGTFPFLAKPFERDHLIGLVEHVLGSPAPTLAMQTASKVTYDPEWFG